MDATTLAWINTLVIIVALIVLTITVVWNFIVTRRETEAHAERLTAMLEIISTRLK